MSVTSDLVRGLAVWLADAGVGLTYRADGTPYTPAEVGIYAKALPVSPDRATAITVYGATDEPKIPVSGFRVQLWFRGRPNDTLDVDDIADPVFLALQGAENLTFGQVHVVQVLRVSSVQLGIDGNKRSERSDNYRVDVDLPVTVGRPG